ncbi:MAG TPA: hypothetical protein VNX70_15840 [Bryobacteraceae bacterium]|jgi:hypothetical protein|nr:hypothetical protein [Bryobacteraceae bacterium]
MAKALGLFLFVASLVPSQSAKEVTYKVDGTAAYATLTTINQNGGTEQNQVKLPFALKFYARGGQSVYLSAQKTRVATTYRGRESVIYDGVSGSVHVLIRVTGAVLQEATSNAPYGIATAKGTLPE